MQKVGFRVVCVAVLIGTLLVSGCQEQPASVVDLSSKVVLDGHGLVRFVNSSMERITNKSHGVTSVRVSWMFENIAGRDIHVGLDVQFFDAANHLLYRNNSKDIRMSAGQREHLFSPWNQILYSGDDAARVDHVVFSVTEIT